MSHIEVRPDALDSAGAALARVGDAITEIATQVGATSGAGDAANQPDVAAAFDAMLNTWKNELRSLGHATTVAGKATASAGTAYVEVDRNVVPGLGR